MTEEQVQQLTRSRCLTLRHGVGPGLLTIFLALFDLVWQDASVLAGALVDLALVPSSLALSLELVTASTQLCDGLFGEEFLQSPLLDILLFVFLQLCNELDGALQDGTFIFLTAWNDLGQLVDALVDSLSPTAFDWNMLAATLM
jgi:hypothetical protein